MLKQFYSLSIVEFVLFVSIYLRSPAAWASNTTKPAWNATWTDLIKRDLLANYDKYARPADHSNTTKVSLKLTVRHIDVDELNAIMTIYGWLAMTWNDEKLKWNPDDYGGLSTIHLAEHEIWQPDITLYNGAMNSVMDSFASSHCLVNRDGTILWVPPSRFQVFCQFDLRLWPFDQQTCIVMLGSWVFNGFEMEIGIDKRGFDLDIIVENNEWLVENISAIQHTKVYNCCVEPYYHVEYNFTIQRRSPMYSTIVITPATCVILLTLSSFWLPPTTGEKILLNGLNFIVICIFLVYFAQQLPVMAINTPLVVLFYSSSLYLVSISMIISVLVLYLSKSKKTCILPWYVKSALEGWLGMILILPRPNYKKSPQPQRGEELRDQTFEDNSTADDNHIIDAPLKVSLQDDWILLATAIDRIFFLVYCLVFVIMSISYSI